MGYNSERFIKSVDPNLMCGICSGVLESPVLTTCGHSFCTHCLKTWLSQAEISTCPECRTWIDSDSAKPIRSHHNLIQAMEVKCINSSRGCDSLIRVEMQETHLLSCKCMPVTCVACQAEMNTSELACHQMNCRAIKSLLEVDNNMSIQKKYSIERLGLTSTPTLFTSYQTKSNMTLSIVTGVISSMNSGSQVMSLLARIRSLEKQVECLLENLKESQSRNTLIYLQYMKTQDELDYQIRLNGHESISSKDQSYAYSSDPFEYNISNQKDIAQLSLLIARNLLDKPRHTDSNRVFLAIHDYYVSHISGWKSEGNHDIHMLLAMAYASNWFDSSQKLRLKYWLQCVLRCQKCKRLVEG